MENFKIFGSELIDEKTIDQIKNCFDKTDYAVLTADAHYGYNHPIGGAIAYKDKISLSGVGFDIACGNLAVKTNILAKDIDISKIMDEIIKVVSFGVGRINTEKVDDPVFEKINDLTKQLNIDKSQRDSLMSKAINQLGTIGSGNHFVDIFEDENDGYIWIGVHFGSRGFGHTLTTGFMALHQGKKFGEKAKQGSMDSKPILFDINTQMGQDYIESINVAGEYAYAGRDWVVNKVLDILGAKQTFEVHNHHNFAWKEEHFGTDYWVVRKGCTPVFGGQKGFIGSNMFDTSVVVEGVDNENSKKGLYSTVHGAGRQLSRTQAAGKKKWIKGGDGKKRPTRISKGLVDFKNTQEKAKTLGVELRGAGADESPECYKKLDDVLSHMGDTIKVLHRLRPIGVAMAGEETFDPYKD